jgi:hypothetical protein
MFSSVVSSERWSRFFSAPALFVAGVWFVMLGGALSFLARFAVNVPYAEDGMLIPYVTGAERLDIKFIWSQYSPHVIPLPKFILFLLARGTYDFRISMYVSVLTCAAVAFALTLAARSLRGHFEYTDAFFALGLLHLGHWECFLLGFAIQEVMFTTLLAVILVVILRSGTALTRREALLVGFCLVLLPSTGAAGFILVPPLALWLAYSAWISRRAGDAGASSTAVLQLALAFIGLAFLTPYLFSLPHGMPWYHGPASVVEKSRALFKVLLQVLTLGFGTGASTTWLPFLDGNRPVYLVGSTVFTLVIASLIVLLVRRQPSTERLRRVGIFLFLLANLLVLTGIAFGRCGYSKTVGLSPRYSLYSVPLLWGIYFAWQLYGASLGSRLVPLGLFAFMCAMFSLNMQLGYSSGLGRCTVLKAVERDLVTPQIPAADIASTYNPSVSGVHWAYYKLKGISDSEQLIRDEMTNMVNMLRQAGIPRRKHLP